MPNNIYYKLQHNKLENRGTCEILVNCGHLAHQNEYIDWTIYIVHACIQSVNIENVVQSKIMLHIRDDRQQLISITPHCRAVEECTISLIALCAEGLFSHTNNYSYIYQGLFYGKMWATQNELLWGDINLEFHKSGCDWNSSWYILYMPIYILSV